MSNPLIAAKFIYNSLFPKDSNNMGQAMEANNVDGLVQSKLVDEFLARHSMYNKDEVSKTVAGIITSMKDMDYYFPQTLSKKGIHSRLNRDLGFDSLGEVELEIAFEINLGTPLKPLESIIGKPVEDIEGLILYFCDKK